MAKLHRESDSFGSQVKEKDCWDKLTAIAALFASVLIPLVVLVAGNAFSKSLKDSENNLKYVELAVSVIRTPPSDSTRALREWAVDVLAKHSSVPLSPDARKELKSNQIDFGSVTYTYPDSTTFYADIQAKSASLLKRSPTK